jgi:hypothetical protein
MPPRCLRKRRSIFRVGLERLSCFVLVLETATAMVNLLSYSECVGRAMNRTNPRANLLRRKTTLLTSQ